MQSLREHDMPIAEQSKIERELIKSDVHEGRSFDDARDSGFLMWARNSGKQSPLHPPRNPIIVSSPRLESRTGVLKS